MRYRFFHLIALSLLLSGCILEEVESYSANTITIASDFLEPGDTVLFADFADKTGIRIKIEQMSADQLIGTIRKSKYNSGIDLIMVRSLYDVNRLNKIGAYHPVSSRLNGDFGLTEYNVYPIGINPFMIAVKSDTVFGNNIAYSDLKSYRGKNTLNHEDFVAFLSHWYTNEDPVVASGNVYSFSLKLPETTKQWSIDSIDFILTGQSQIEKIKNDSLYKRFKHIIQPVEPEKGIFFNVFTIGFLNQADDYILAEKLIDYLSLDANNDRMARSLNLVPMSDAEKINYLPIGKNLQYLTQVERAIARETAPSHEP